MILETRAVEPFYKNGFVLGCEETREGAVIDPGDEVEGLIAAASNHRLTIRYILLTHAHLDHITGVARAKEAFGAPVVLHRDDLFLYDAAPDQGRMFGFDVPRQPPPDMFYGPDQVIPFGRLEAHVHHTPGHCPGGVCLQVGHAGKPGLKLFVGDTLFAGSIGRTDLPGGDLPTLMRSIREVLFRFPDESEVYSGHGPVTTIGQEKRTNPFVGGA
ncbi:MAG TPA: MBL fold metallo-hydrolase [Vicinamibacterales bacterium]|nr:MBL fold metallo-hydrolase [Vicinamibacterales bacterium]